MGTILARLGWLIIGGAAAALGLALVVILSGLIVYGLTLVLP